MLFSDPLRSNAGPRRRCLSCCCPCHRSPATRAPSCRTLTQEWLVWSQVSATWRWTTGTSDSGGLGGETLVGILMGNSLSIKDEIRFCNGPLVNNPNLQLIVTVLRQVKSQQSSCLFLTSLARFGSLDMHSCTAPMASLPPFHTHLFRDCTHTSPGATIPHAKASEKHLWI